MNTIISAIWSTTNFKTKLLQISDWHDKSTLIRLLKMSKEQLPVLHGQNHQKWNHVNNKPSIWAIL